MLVVPTKVTKRTISPSLGWLDAFLCTADRLDYKHAAQDLGIHASSVEQRVLKLEIWLRKILILDDVRPLEISEGDGEKFVHVALDIVQTFSASRANGVGVVRSKKCSSITLADLEHFLAVADEGNYKGAGFASNRDGTAAWHSVRALENALGKTLVLGRSALRLSDEGAEFRSAATHIVNSFYDFRAVIPADYDPDRAAAERAFKANNLIRCKVAATASLIEMTGKKQRGRVRLEDVKRELNFFNLIHAQLLDKYGPFDSVSGKDIDVPA